MDNYTIRIAGVTLTTSINGALGAGSRQITRANPISPKPATFNRIMTPPQPSPPPPPALSSIKSRNKKRDKKYRAIIGLMCADELTTANKVADLMGYSNSGAQKDIKMLTNAGLVHCIGKLKPTSNIPAQKVWRPTSEGLAKYGPNAPPYQPDPEAAGVGLSPDHRAKLVARRKRACKFIATRAGKTRQEVAQHLNIKFSIVYNDFVTLIKEGLVETVPLNEQVGEKSQFVFRSTPLGVNFSEKH